MTFAILPIISAVATIGATVIGMKSAKDQGNYQAQVANNNAVIATQNAAAASDTAQVTQEDSDNQAAALIASQEAEQGASGLSLNSASMLRTRRTAQTLAGQDSSRIRDEGAANVRGYLQQAENFRGEASAAKAGAAGSMLGTFFSGVGSLAGTFSKAKSGSSLFGAQPQLAGGASPYRGFLG